jgi:hypothetical protein
MVIALMAWHSWLSFAFPGPLSGATDYRILSDAAIALPAFIILVLGELARPKRQGLRGGLQSERRAGLLGLV